MIAKHRTQPKTLGLLGTSLVTAMQNRLWQGAMHAAQAHGARLIYYPTVSLGSFPAFVPSSQVLFDFIDGEHLDGIVVWYAGIVEGIVTTEYKDFFEHFQALPVVTVGGQLSHYPDLSIDNIQGVKTAVEHLIRAHGRRHFGIIRGPVGHPDADERYQSCVATLHAHNLPVNPDRVCETLFALKVATDTTQAAITRWIKDSGQQLDAVITASDYMALAAIEAVEACGLRVPEDVAVIGFDDVSQAQASIPLLTTVRQPFYEMGRQAVATLLEMIDGRVITEHRRIAAPLIVRESCGCVLNSFEGDEHGEPVDAQAGAYTNISPAERLSSELIRLAQNTDFPAPDVEALAHILAGDMGPDGSQQFLARLRHLLDDEAATAHFDAGAWQTAISALRNFALAHALSAAVTVDETLFHRARMLVTAAMQRAHIRQRLLAEEQIETLRRTSEALNASFGRQLLLDTISEQLPTLGFSGIYLSLYEDSAQPETWSRLILAQRYDQRRDLPREGIRFPTKQLVPAGMLPANHTTSLVVEPLYFEERQLGMLVLEVGPEQGMLYENVRAELSSALQGSQLLAEVQNHAAQLEQHVADRTNDLRDAITRLEAEVSERQKAQDALAHERNLLRTLVDSMPEIIFAKDTSGRFILKNETDAHWMGAESPEETIGKTDFDYYPPELAERFKTDDERVFRTGESLINQEEFTVDAQGREHWLLTTKVPLRDAQGNIIGLVGMGHDITQRKQAEEALRKSEEMALEFQEKLKNLQEISLELVAAESLEQLCVRAVELGHSALGYDRLGLLLFDDAARTKASRFGIESDGKLHIETGMAYPAPNDGVMLTSVLTDRKAVYVNEDADLGDFDRRIGRGWNIITGIWDGNTSIGWLAADNFFSQKPLMPYQVELLNLYGLTIGHLVSRKRAEAEIHRLNAELEQRVTERTAELQAAHDRLQVLSRAKDEFVSNVSHELRTPIANITLYNELLVKRPEKSGRYSAILRREVDRLDSLIEALLALSRLDQHREKIAFAPNDVNELLRQLVTDREALALEKDITLDLELETEPVIVEADRRLLEQVLSILLTNAFAYTPSGGCVTVRSLKRITDGQLWGGFSVSDTGAGIAQDEIKRLFDRFFRGQAARDSNTPGTGLGLAIAKEIVDRHRGAIEVFSKGPGQGTAFSVWVANKRIEDSA